MYTNIKPSTKNIVYKRDDGKCIFCKKKVSVLNACCHVVPRSKGGLGKESNIVTLCGICHHLLDFTSSREVMMKQIKNYLKKQYEGWDEKSQIYVKGGSQNE